MKVFLVKVSKMKCNLSLEVFKESTHISGCEILESQGYVSQVG